MEKIIHIGTRDSELALWQAHDVQNKIEKLGFKTKIVPIKSKGDLILDRPIYKMGIVGVFTRQLDLALLNDSIDIAVHSMKDVPTQLPVRLKQGAVLERSNCSDVLIYKNNLDFLNQGAMIATGSLRRKAQWLNKYPEHCIVNLRGNIATRMKKLQESDWNGAIFAHAGLKRLNISTNELLELSWMIPAPAQGAIVVIQKEKDKEIEEILKELNHYDTEQCVKIERDFLSTLEGGCSAPIGAYARVENGSVFFTGALFSLDGQIKICVEEKGSMNQLENLGISSAQKILSQGGLSLMQEIKSVISK